MMREQLWSLLIAGALASATVSAQDEDTPAQPVEVQDEVAQPTDEPEDLPSLDDLLGIEDDDEDGGTGAVDPDEERLDQLLSGNEIGDALVEAVTMMGSVADRIAEHRDTGIKTQRMQEDIIRKLDQLIESVQQQQSQSSSSSSSSSQQQQQQQQQQQPNQPQQGEQRQPGQDSNAQATPPGRQDGALRPDLEAATAMWGTLPARVRDMMRQGSTDRFSQLYQRMTEAYYRRLAEEASGQ